jgi:hypothetical protein
MEGNVIAPYDPVIKKAIAKGAIALAIVRNRRGTPGQGMYYVNGEDQMGLTIPVVEIYQVASTKHRIEDAMGPEGLEVALWPMENKWKKANDIVGFQIFFNVLLSGMEVTIFLIGLWRIHEWTLPSWSRLFSIGPVCIILEMISATLRFISTVVDPFFTFRVYIADLGMVLLTISVPFLLSSGILLTFFWAETLRASHIKASPFIAEYKKSAGVAIFLLFAGEIATTSVRMTLPVTGSFNPAYLSQVYYVIVSIALIVCYLMCAHQIQNRLAAAKSKSKRKDFIRNMNIRFALSSGGYMAFCLSVALSIPLFLIPWGWKIVFNMMVFSLNWSGLMQVYSLKPSKGGSQSHSNSTRGIRSTSDREQTHTDTGPSEDS